MNDANVSDLARELLIREGDLKPQVMSQPILTAEGRWGACRPHLGSLSTVHLHLHLQIVQIVILLREEVCLE